MMKRSMDSCIFATHSTFDLPSSDEENEAKGALFFASYLQEIAFAKIGLLGRGLKAMEWPWPSLVLSPDVRPVSDPEPGLGRKVEVRQKRVGSSGWAAPLSPL